jgi:hypothetical protein
VVGFYYYGQSLEIATGEAERHQREKHIHLYMYSVYVLTMNVNFVIVQYILPAILIIGEFFFYGFTAGFGSNEQVTLTFFMIAQLVPLAVGNYFRSKSEACIIMRAVDFEN